MLPLIYCKIDVSFGWWGIKAEFEIKAYWNQPRSSKWTSLDLWAPGLICIKFLLKTLMIKRKENGMRISVSSAIF